jgi:hypothetical protein
LFLDEGTASRLGPDVMSTAVTPKMTLSSPVPSWFDISVRRTAMRQTYRLIPK